MELLHVQHGKGFIILLFRALPTTISYGTVPMREPYQILFFVLACYGLLRFRLSGRPLHLIVAMGFALLMGLLHKGLIIYAPFLVTIMLFLRVDRDRPGARPARGRVYLHRFAAIALAIGFVAAMSSAARELEGVHGAEILTAATRGGLVDLAVGQRDDEALTAGRTAYGAALNTDFPVAFVYSAVVLFLYYMLTPFPWQVRSIMDIYAFAEVILRVLTLLAIFRMWRRGGPVPPQIVTLLMIIYFSMAFLWATGTSNWGTATRHHMLHQWLLLLLGVPALIQSLPGFARRHPVAPRAEGPRLSRSRGARVGARIPHLKSLVDTSFSPRRLGIEQRHATGRQISGDAGPRPWSGGLGQLQRLADAPRRLTKG